MAHIPTPRRLPHILPRQSFNHDSSSVLHPIKQGRTTLQILSDVHLDVRTAATKLPVVVPKYGQNLALLGNIGNPFHVAYTEFIRQQSQLFENVFLLLGDSEYRCIETSDVGMVTRQAENVCRRFTNVHLMEQAVFDITTKTRILGTYRPNQRIWLDDEVRRCKDEGRHAVILTTPRSLCPKLFNPPVVAIATGTCSQSPYTTCDFRLNGVRVVSNAMGRPGEESGYDEDIVIDID